MSKKMSKASENINVVLSWIFLWVTIVLGALIHVWTVVRLALHATVLKAVIALVTPIASELVVALNDIQSSNGVLQGSYPTAVAVFLIFLALALITRMLKPESASKVVKAPKKAAKKAAKAKKTTSKTEKKK